MRRLFILWSTLRPSEIELFCATASFGFDHLSSIAIWADDAFETVDPDEIELRLLRRYCPYHRLIVRAGDSWSDALDCARVECARILRRMYGNDGSLARNNKGGAKL